MSAPIARAGLRRCHKCGFIAAVHGMAGFADCDLTPGQIPLTPELDEYVQRVVAAEQASVARALLSDEEFVRRDKPRTEWNPSIGEWEAVR